MKNRHDTYCGLNCGACPVGMANEAGDTEALKKMADEWGATQEQLKCNGCKTDVISGYCVRCEMRECAREKKVEFCNQCDEYPCDVITDFRNDNAPHHSVVFSNLRKIKEQGAEEWLKSENSRWACPDCNARFNWYTENCGKCGAEVYNAVREEQNLKE